MYDSSPDVLWGAAASPESLADPQPSNRFFVYLQRTAPRRAAPWGPESTGAGRGLKALKVGAILIITVFLVFVASFVILRTKRHSSTEDAPALPPAGPGPRGLFGDAADDDESPSENPELVRRG